MAQADPFFPAKSGLSDKTQPGKATAAGLFGYSIRDGRVRSFAPIIGYVRDLEQLPNFSAPNTERFVAQYVRSNIGVTRSSS